LLLSGAPFLEIANDADAYAGIVDAGLAHMAAAKLLGPAGADLNLAVAGVASVSDHKMISEAILHPSTAMVGIVGASTACLDPAVVNDDVAPAVAIDLDLAGGRDHGSQRGEGRKIAGDDQLLANEDAVALEVIAALQRSDGSSTALGNGGERVAFFNFVAGLAGLGGRPEKISRT